MDRPESITIDEQGNVTVIRLIGDHDVSTVAELRATLETLPPSTGVVVSLAETTFFDSSVIHTLIGTGEKLRERKQPLVIHVPVPSLGERILQAFQPEAPIPLTFSLDEALALARSASHMD